MTRFVEEVGLAARRLAREPGFTVTAVATMAIGIGIAASVFALVEGVLLRPLAYPDSERLVTVRHETPGTELRDNRTSPGMYLHHRDGNRTLEAIGGYFERAHTFTDGGTSERLRTASVTPELFSVLRVTPQLGRLPTAADHTMDHLNLTGTTGILLSHDLWVRRYGADPDVVGRTIEIDGQPYAVVTGVAPEGFFFPEPETRAWLAFPMEELPWSGRAAIREGMYMGTIARLLPGVTLSAAEADLNHLVQLLPEAFPDVSADDLRDLGLRATVRPYKEEVVGDVRLTLLLVLASGGFLLLVTWANVANLLLLRTHRRRAEIGIARALGASEGHVIRRLLGESLILTMTGGILGLGLAFVATRTRFGFAPHQLPRLDGVGVNGIVVGFVALPALVSGILMAAICLGGARQRVAGPGLSALRSRSTTDDRDGMMGRRALVSVQMALALTLLIGSGLMARTFWQLQQVSLGFETEGRLSFYLPLTHTGPRADYHELSRVHDQLLDRLRAVPGVDAAEAATASVVPLTFADAEHLAPIAPAGVGARMDGDWPFAQYGFATPGYFDAMGIRLREGRTFRSEDTSAEAPGVVISRALARELFPGSDAIGRAVEFVGWNWATFTVVGVVADVPATTLRDGGSRAIYLPNLYPPAASAITGTLFEYVPLYERYVIRTTRDLPALVPELRRAIDEIDPRIPMLGVATFDEVVAGATGAERITMRLLLVSAAAALFLGIVGIYGVLAYSVRRRTTEIGIRIALGASPLQVVRLVVLQGALLSGGGIAVGLGASLLLTRFIGSVLYDTSPTDPPTFAGVTLLLFGVALAASYLPARRASRIDPANALRAE